ncbi:ABC transporter A family member 11-like [Dermatophagoides farinae]|uniref:ABC transporter A family member 11-like n=1 Tax=Dermatophagoides farinae TaxID=6954 RepID=UPI003F636C86
MKAKIFITTYAVILSTMFAITSTSIPISFGLKMIEEKQKSVANGLIAINGLSLGLQKGQVFGLLGPNGAGKTTTINVLSYDPFLDAPPRGETYIGGINLMENPKRVFPYLGLLPQFDVLWTDITTLDNIYVFAKIKGLSNQQTLAASDALITRLELQTHKNKRLDALSGGNRKRASVVVTFLTTPRCVLIDEPSSGIDPIGRRKLMELIHERKHNATMILTTHSMEEAENLCSKVGIMMNGELQCYNTCLAIKNKYGSGFRLEIDLLKDKIKSSSDLHMVIDKITKFLKEKCNSKCYLSNHVGIKLLYLFPPINQMLPYLFELLEKEKSKLLINEYSISQPTLDQVFNSLCKKNSTANNSQP